MMVSWTFILRIISPSLWLSSVSNLHFVKLSHYVELPHWTHRWIVDYAHVVSILKRARNHPILMWRSVFISEHLVQSQVGLLLPSIPSEYLPKFCGTISSCKCVNSLFFVLGHSLQDLLIQLFNQLPIFVLKFFNDVPHLLVFNIKLLSWVLPVHYLVSKL